MRRSISELVVHELDGDTAKVRQGMKKVSDFIN